MASSFRRIVQHGFQAVLAIVATIGYEWRLGLPLIALVPLAVSVLRSADYTDKWFLDLRNNANFSAAVFVQDVVDRLTFIIAAQASKNVIQSYRSKLASIQTPWIRVSYIIIFENRLMCT